MLWILYAALDAGPAYNVADDFMINSCHGWIGSRYGELKLISAWAAAAALSPLFRFMIFIMVVASSCSLNADSRSGPSALERLVCNQESTSAPIRNESQLHNEAEWLFLFKLLFLLDLVGAVTWRFFFCWVELYKSIYNNTNKEAESKLKRKHWKLL